jgi:hypothetical protein
MPQLSFKLLKYFFFSAKIFFTIFLIIVLFILFFSADIFYSFLNAYYLTSFTILLPGISLIIDGEKPINAVGYSICVILFITVTGLLFYFLSIKFKSINNLINTLDYSIVNILTLIFIALILIFPYYTVIDLF